MYLDTHCMRAFSTGIERPILINVAELLRERADGPGLLARRAAPSGRVTTVGVVVGREFTWRLARH